MKGNPEPPFYTSLQAHLDAKQIKVFTPQVIRDAVIAIRNNKLPDPAKVANNGSFFSNPIVSAADLEQLKASNPEIAFWETENGRIKLSAAWLVEQAGFKGTHDPETGMAVWPSQSIVLVNEHATKTADLLKFKQKIVDAVKNRFGVTLEQEPELLGI